MSERMKLLPCPFCGAEAGLGLAPLKPQPAWVECLSCPSEIEADTEAEAIAAWNRRPIPHEAVEAAKELLVITQGSLGRIGMIYERLPSIRLVARALLSLSGDGG